MAPRGTYAHFALLLAALVSCTSSRAGLPHGAGSGGSFGGASGTGGSAGSGGGMPGASGSGGLAGGSASGGMAPASAGNAGSVGNTGNVGGAGGNGGATGDGTGVIGMPPAPDKPPTPENAGPLALRRLTAREYQNTLTDLLGMPQNVASPFPIEEISRTGFLAPTGFTALHTDKIFELSEKLADTALRAGTIPFPCPGTNCAVAFINSFGRRVFRRPVTLAEGTDLMSVFALGTMYGLDIRTALTHVVSAMLQSPNFLYHWEIGDEPPSREGDLVVLTPYQVASRLSYFLWETMPDETLLAAADANQLATPEQVLAQAKRMLTVPTRTKSGLANFHEQWLRVQGLGDVVKDPARYPSFTPTLEQAVGEELRVFVSSVLSGAGDGTLKSLLTAPYSYANSALGGLYGFAATGDSFVQVQLNPAERAGILTQGAFLATHATPSLTDPVKRGRVIWQGLLCGNTPARLHPTDDQPGPVDPMATNRDRYVRSSAASCAECHKFFDPLGFAFENYNAIGAYQTTDNGKPVNATGEALTPGGARIPFRNAIDLVKGLADSDEVKWCVTRQWFRHLLGRFESSADLGSLERAHRAAAAVPGFSIRDMLMTTVQTKAFRYRALSPGEM